MVVMYWRITTANVLHVVLENCSEERKCLVLKLDVWHWNS